MAQRILAIHAHPDDCEILAGGTLALLSAEGHAITICTLTPGDCGAVNQPPEVIARIRRAEAKAAADLLGADYVCAGFRDLNVFSDNPSRRRVCAVLRAARPNIVLTASPVDYMCDHEAASELVRDACFGSPAPNYDTSDYGNAPPLPAIPHLYFMDPIAGADRANRPVVPDFLVDVTEVMGKKRELLACHESQREWLRAQHGIDEYLDAMERWTQGRGKIAGVAYAEGFRQYTGHPYPTAPALQQLLGRYLRTGGEAGAPSGPAH